MVLCIGTLCVAIFVAVVAKNRVSPKVWWAAVVMILVSVLAILAHISEVKEENSDMKLELVRPAYGEGDYEEEMTLKVEDVLDEYSYHVVVPELTLSKLEEQR